MQVSVIHFTHNRLLHRYLQQPCCDKHLAAYATIIFGTDHMAATAPENQVIAGVAKLGDLMTNSPPSAARTVSAGPRRFDPNVRSVRRTRLAAYCLT
jgi:hypothetical protein